LLNVELATAKRREAPKKTNDGQKDLGSASCCASLTIALTSTFLIVGTRNARLVKSPSSQNKNQPNNQAVGKTVNHRTEKRRRVSGRQTKPDKNHVARKQRHGHSHRSYSKQDEKSEENRTATQFLFSSSYTNLLTASPTKSCT